MGILLGKVRSQIHAHAQECDLLIDLSCTSHPVDSPAVWMCNKLAAYGYIHLQPSKPFQSLIILRVLSLKAL